MRFFIETPSDRIIYSLSYDQMVLDDRIGFTIRYEGRYLLFILGAMLIMNYVYYGIFLVITVFSCWYLYRLLERYLNKATVLVQIAEESRAKFVTIFLQVLNGAMLYKMTEKATARL